ncbi:MAG: hypothetical protein HY436_01225 [Candidatus Liptonbacteria bacterium]|nr:hypothetical protein [Candidatus Liptonbacteria bacterium]
MKTFFTAVIIVLVVAIGIVLIVQRTGVGAPEAPGTEVVSGTTPEPGKTIAPPPTQTQSGNTPPPADSNRFRVRYTDNGFVPKTLTIPSGSRVEFFNDSSRQMWVASDVHPTHEILAAFDQLGTAGRGVVYAFTFDKKGTWAYHNHVRAQDTGTIIVE